MGYDLISINRPDNSSDRKINSALSRDIENNDPFKERFNIFQWPRLLDLARSYGWQPLRTQCTKKYAEENPNDWNGSYSSNDGQLVTAEDALALAEALEKALDDIPDQEDLIPKTILLTSNKDVETFLKINGDETIKMLKKPGFVNPSNCIPVPNVMLTPLEFFSGHDKQHIIRFISFCQKGAFEIW